MSNLIPFQFNTSVVRVITLDNGDILFLARDIAVALGYQNPSKAYQDHCKHLIKLSYNELLELNYDKPNPQGEIFIKENDVFRLTMKSSASNAEQFQDWVCDDVLPSIRKTGSYSMQQPALPQSAIEIQIAESAARMLRMSEASKIRMLSKICDNHNVPSNFLPEYTDEQLTRSLGDLLKDHGMNISAVKANPILLELGLLEKLERRSSKGTKSFWSITDRGLQYGKNETPPGGSANETAPKWYVGKFSEVARMIKAHSGESNVVSIVN